MLPTLHHGLGLNQSRLEYQPIINDNRNSNINEITDLKYSNNDFSYQTP